MGRLRSARHFSSPESADFHIWNMSDTLTPKQEKFAQRLVETDKPSESYRHAYDAENMSDEAVSVEACRLQDNPRVALRIAELRQLHLKRHQVTVDRVVSELSKLAFLDIRKAFDEEGNLKPIHELDDDTAAAIAGLEVEVRRVTGEADEELEGQPHGGALKRQHGATARLHKIKLSDKKGALDSLARYLGIFVDRTELTGKDGGPVVVTTKEQRDAAVAAALAADA